MSAAESSALTLLCRIAVKAEASIESGCHRNQASRDMPLVSDWSRAPPDSTSKTGPSSHQDKGWTISEGEKSLSIFIMCMCVTIFPTFLEQLLRVRLEVRDPVCCGPGSAGVLVRVRVRGALAEGEQAAHILETVRRDWGETCMREEFSPLSGDGSQAES